MIKLKLLIFAVMCLLFIVFFSFPVVAQETSTFNLKLNLEPKLEESRIYLKEDLYFNWDFGFFSTNEKIAPLIMKKENFFQVETNGKINYFWGQNNMKLFVLNPHKNSIKSTLSFEADAYKTMRNMEIWVNGGLLAKVEVPKQNLDLTKFRVENIILTPGINIVTLFSPQGKSKINRQKSFDREVSFRFNTNINFKTESFIENSEFEDVTEYEFFDDEKKLNVNADLKKTSFPGIILSRNLDVDLNEFPILELNCSSKENKLGFKMYFIIDVSGDNQPDLSVDLDIFDFEEIDILKMVSDQISFVANNPKLLKIILVGTFLPEAKDLSEIDVCLSDVNFCNLDSAIEVPISIVDIKNWVIDDQFKGKIKTYFNDNSLRFSWGNDSRGNDSVVSIKRFFLKTNEVIVGEVLERKKDTLRLRLNDGKEIEILLSQIKYSDNYRENIIGLKKDELVVNFNLTEPIEPGILKLVYKVDNFDKQDVAVYVDLDRDNDGTVDARVLAGVRNSLPEWQLKQECHDFKIYESYRPAYNVGYSGEDIDVDNFALYDGLNLLKTSFDNSGGYLLDDPNITDEKQLVLALPHTEFLNPNNASIVYKVLTKNSVFPDWLNYEVDLSWLLKNDPSLRIKKISLHLLNKDSLDIKDDISAFSGFSVKSIGMYKRFLFPVVESNAEYQKLKEKINIPLLKLDEDIFYLSDFDQLTSLKDIKNNSIEREITLKSGPHKYKKIENDIVNIKWVLLEPKNKGNSDLEKKGPIITFKQINPAKYVIDVKGAKKPFWLVFSESFHVLWHVYHINSNESGLIIRDYPELQVKELEHEITFSFKDIMFLFKNSLPVTHQTVNGYANGWYIDPEKLGIGENFTLVLFFSSQAFLCLGLFLFLIMVLFFFARVFFMRRKKSAK